jgi:vancomycin resistance protein YoaR
MLIILKKLFSLQAKSKKDKKSSKKKFINFRLVVGLIIFLPILAICAYEAIFWNRVLPYIRIADFNVAGKTQNQLNQFLTSLVEKKQSQTIELYFEDKKWVLPTGRFDLFYSPSSTVNKALLTGKQGTFGQILSEQKAAFWQQLNLGFDYQLNKDLLSQDIASLAAQIDLPAIPPTIEIVASASSKNIVITEGQPGRKIDQDKVISKILSDFGQLQSEPIILEATVTFPPIDKKMIQDTKARAEKLLGKKIVLFFGKDSWEIQEKELVNFLSFYGGWDKEKITDYTEGFAQSIDRPPQNALFNFAGGRVLEFKPGMDGLTLDQEKTIKLITQALQDLEKNQQNNLVKVNLPVSSTKPSVSTEQVNTFGIKQLIGEGKSWFYGSIAARIYNIKLAASKINGVLVAPGETFSLNQAIGDISAATGFQQAYVIQEGRTVLGDGGGVCQVSTTVFRTVLDAGLPVEERHAHAYRVGYYEYNSAPGLDATIFYPTDDFKFKNDTPAHILIQTVVDTSQSLIKVQFYGTQDGRQVTISPSKVWDQVPPPPDLYQDDPTLPQGTVKQVDWRAWGAKVAFDWKVVRNGQTLQERTFYSQYKPWQAIFLRGTKP